MGRNEPGTGSLQERHYRKLGQINMRRVISIGIPLFALLAAAQADAADMYRAQGGYRDGPAYIGTNWSGFYAGVNGGYGWANNNQLVDPGWFDGISPSGGFGGGQLGYNWQGLSHFVLGFETDIQGSGIGASALAVDGMRVQVGSRLFRNGAGPCWLCRGLGASLFHGRVCVWRPSQVFARLLRGHSLPNE